MYFTRFNPLFPILHSATFRPTAENSHLILSITSIGCLFLGSPAAARRGRQIFKSLNKAILASVSANLWIQPLLIFPQWDDVILQKNDEALAMLQAAVLGQTFALLSGVGSFLNCPARSEMLTYVSIESQRYCAVRDISW